MPDTMTHAELVDAARERFGPDPTQWAFVCPQCGDVATPADFVAAGSDANRIGQECIGRTLPEAAEPRGCDWVAYGLIPGPLTVTMPNGEEIGSFRLAGAR